MANELSVETMEKAQRIWNLDTIGEYPTEWLGS